MSKFDELKKLDELLKDGAITQKEFDQQKEKLLGTKTSSMKLKDISSMKLKDISSMKLKDLILKPSKWFLNWFLGLDKKSKIIVVILLLIITIQTFPEESSTDIVAEQETTTTTQLQETTTTTQLQETTTTTQLQETTTTTQLQETINTQCVEWDKATKSNNLKMAQLLETYVDQTENYINNEISFDKYLSILDELIYESGELLDLQKETIPNKENEVADGWVQGAFSAYNQGFYSYKTGQEENDVFWINEGNDNLDFGTFSITEYYNTIEDC
jgi:hypothetical protein